MLMAEYRIGTVRKGKLSKWFDYEIIKYEQEDGKVHYRLEVDGDDEGCEWPTVKSAMQYVNDLKANGDLP